MAGILDRVLSFLGLAEEEEEDFDPEWEPEARDGSRRANVVGLPAARPVKIYFSYPVVFDTVQEVATALRDRCPVLLNLEETPREEARRIIDFLGGAVYALDGRMLKVGQGIFLLAPRGVEVLGERLYEVGAGGGR